ncbi:unnamed protein product [Rotaria magnacalcarata]
MIVRLVYIYQYIQSDDSYGRLLKNVQLEKPLPIFHSNRKLHKFDFAFIQLYINANDIYGRYYLIASNNSCSNYQLATSRAMHISTTVSYAIITRH